MKKDLEKLYNEYKQIKAGKKENKPEIPHDQQNLKSLKNAFDKFMAEEGGVQHFDDGGQAQSDDDSTLYNLGKSIQHYFNTPTPKTSQEQPESQEDKYARIRQQNQERAMGQRNSIPSQDSDQQVQKTMGLFKGGKVPHYADGTDDVEASDPVTGNVDPNSPEGLEMIKNASYPEAAQVSDNNIPDEPEVDINASLAKPAQLADVEESDDVDKAAIEKPYDTEELAAELASDKKSPKDKEELEEDEKEEEQDANKSDASKDEDKDKEEPREVASEDQSKSDEDNSDEDQSNDSKSAPVLNDLQKAQKQRDLNTLVQGIQEGGALFGSGVARTDPTQALKVLQNQAKSNDLPIEKYKEQVANQQFDPNSDMSKVTRAYLASKGIKVGDDTSAATVFKVAPFYQKDTALQGAIQKVLLQGKIKQDIVTQQQSGADKRAAAHNAIEQQKADAMRGQKINSNQDKALAQTQQMLESARGNPAAAQAEKDLYSTQKINSLFNAYPGSLNKIPDAQVNLIVSEINKVATGGVPTGHEQDALKPNTPESRLAKLWGQLQNAPTGANAGAYLKEFQKYNNVLAKDAQQVIKDKYGRVIESRKSQLGPDNYKSLQDQYLNRFGASDQAPAVDADLTKMNADQLQAYIKAHGGQ